MNLAYSSKVIGPGRFRSRAPLSAGVARNATSRSRARDSAEPLELLPSLDEPSTLEVSTDLIIVDAGKAEQEQDVRQVAQAPSGVVRDRGDLHRDEVFRTRNEDRDRTGTRDLAATPEDPAARFPFDEEQVEPAERGVGVQEVGEALGREKDLESVVHEALQEGNASRLVDQDVEVPGEAGVPEGVEREAPRDGPRHVRTRKVSREEPEQSGCIHVATDDVTGTPRRSEAGEGAEGGDWPEGTG